MNFWSFLGLASAADMRALREELRAAKEENEALRLQASDRIISAGQEHMSELRELLQGIRKEADALRIDESQNRAELQKTRQELLLALSSARDTLSDHLVESKEERSNAETQILQCLETSRTQREELLKQIVVLQDFLAASEKRILENLKVHYAQGTEIQEKLGRLRELLDLSKVEAAGLQDLVRKGISQQEDACSQLKDLLSALARVQEQGLEDLTQAEAEREQRLRDEFAQLKEDANNAEEALLSAIHMANLREDLQRLEKDKEDIQETLLATKNDVDLLPEIKNYLSMLWEVTKLVWVNDLLSDLEKEL